MGIIGQLASQIAERPLPNLFAWTVSPSYFNDNWKADLSGRWGPLVKSLVPLIVSNIEGEMKDAVRSTQALETIARKVGFQIQSLKSLYDRIAAPINDVTSLTSTSEGSVEFRSSVAFHRPPFGCKSLITA
jgi:hypothetical protein